MRKSVQQNSRRVLRCVNLAKAPISSRYFVVRIGTCLDSQTVEMIFVIVSQEERVLACSRGVEIIDFEVRGDRVEHAEMNVLELILAWSVLL